MEDLEKIILNKDFDYDPPHFYNNELALRCELGIGKTDDEYLTNAKNRAAAIFNILFERGVDMFFFDNYVYDLDFDTGDEVNVDSIISAEKNRLEFCLGYQKKYKHKIIRDVARDEDNDIIRRNRICCYPDKKFNAINVINAQIESQIDPTIHLVSFINNCILTVYDDRGCDIVFYDKGKLVEFYPLLQKYFLDFDKALMETRFNDCKK